jgi:hypothetical protein
VIAFNISDFFGIAAANIMAEPSTGRILILSGDAKPVLQAFQAAIHLFKNL